MRPINVGLRDLILFAGLPGAGKSTVLARLCHLPGVTVCDSGQLRDLLGARLPSWLPYRVYRPLVHLGHHLRVLVAALRAPGPLLVHDPATRAVTRAALALLARLTGRPAVFVWLDVPPRLALEGQRARGRVIPPRSFARHVARAAVLRRGLLAGDVPTGWRNVVLLDRAGTCAGPEVVLAEACHTGAVGDATGAGTPPR